MKELKERVENDKEGQATADLAVLLFETATVRSGFKLQDSADFADRIERMLRLSVNVSPDEPVSFLLFSYALMSILLIFTNPGF